MVIDTRSLGDVVGRASNRKKARRQAGHSSRQAQQSPRDGAVSQQAMLHLVAGLKALTQEIETRGEQNAAACRAWCGGRQPVPADAPRWPERSLGERFFSGTDLEKAQEAPSLLTADVPEATAIAADPAHWSVAASVLVRAVVFDGLRIDHPGVTRLLDVLAPIAEAELAYNEAAEARLDQNWCEWDEDEPEFPEMDGPVFLLGTCALVEATWAVVGEDPLHEVLAVLAPAVDGALPGLEGQVVADALIGAFAVHYRCEQPGDADVLERIGQAAGNPLENLVAAGAVSPRDVLETGLTVLSALAGLCKSDSASILQRVA